jgi:hypothetical protein
LRVNPFTVTERQGLRDINYAEKPFILCAGYGRIRRRRSNDMPVVFVPEETETECVAQHRMSSFGFMGNAEQTTMEKHFFKQGTMTLVLGIVICGYK